MADIAYNFGMSLCSDDKLLFQVLAVIIIADTLLCVIIYCCTSRISSILYNPNNSISIVGLWLVIAIVSSSIITYISSICSRVDNGLISRYEFNYYINRELITIAISVVINIIIVGVIFGYCYLTSFPDEGKEKKR